MTIQNRSKNTRRQGDGSIYKYTTGEGVRYRWQAFVTANPNESHSEVKRVSKGGFKTAKEANASMQAALSNVRSGKVAIPSADLFGDYAMIWLDSKKIANSTRVGYEKILRVHLLPRLGHLKLRDIFPGTIAKMYRDLEKSGNQGRLTKGTALTANTVNKIHIVLGSILQAAMLDGKVPVNHARNNPAAVNAPTGADILDQQEELKVWTGEELGEFLFWDIETYEDDLFALWLLFAWTGMRRGEGVALKWQDINFKNNTISIRRSSDSALRKTVKNSTKTKKNRSIAVDEETMSVIQEHKRRRAQMGIHLAAPDAFVFGNLDGSVRNPGDVGERFTRTVKKAQQVIPNLPDLTIKGLRHTHATLMLESGIHAKVVQERLGHSNITTTLNIYSHVTPTMQEDAMNRLRKYVNSQEKPFDENEAKEA
jgi:integrase